MLFTKYSADKIKRNERKRKINRVFFGGGGPEGRRSLGKPKPLWQDNIKANVKDISWHEMH